MRDGADLLGEVEVSGFFHEMAVGEFAVGQLDFVMNQLVMVFIGFDAQKCQRQQNGAGVEEFELAEVAGPCRPPRRAAW